MTDETPEKQQDSPPESQPESDKQSGFEGENKGKQTPSENNQEKEEENKLDKILSSVDNVNKRMDKLEGQGSTEEQPPADEPPTPEDKKEWQPNTWGQAEKDVRKFTNEELDKRDQIKQDEVKKEGERKLKVNQMLDDQEKQLEEKGMLPKMEDPNNQDDPGRIARKELYGVAAKVGSSNLLSTGEMLKDMHDSGKRFDVRSGKFVKSKPASHGKDVPVGSSSSTNSPQETGKPSYKDIHNLSMDQLIKRAQQ